MLVRWQAKYATAEQEIQRLTDVLAQRQTEYATAEKRNQQLTGVSAQSDADRAAAEKQLQRLTTLLADREAIHAVALAELQRANTAIEADVNRLAVELRESQAKYAAATAETQSLTEMLRTQANARIEQEQYATIFRRKCEELTQELSRREATFATALAEAARLKAANARLVCEHADMIARLADHAEAERLARNTGRLTIEKPDPQHAARRIDYS